MTSGEGSPQITRSGCCIAFLSDNSAAQTSKVCPQMHSDMLSIHMWKCQNDSRKSFMYTSPGCSWCHPVELLCCSHCSHVLQRYCSSFQGDVVIQAFILLMQAYGEDIAILAGDALLSLSFEYIARETRNVAAERILRVWYTYDACTSCSWLS